MALSHQQVEDLVKLTRKKYPNWAGFADPKFIKDEIDYKRTAVTKASKLLSQAEFQQLIAASKYDDLLDRLKQVGSTNLLYRSTPAKGDLGILYSENPDKPAFLLAVMDLLYGQGTSPDRLGRYLQYVQDNHLPNKWTFPTYFLFVCHPDTEMFVKPETTKAFLNWLGRSEVWSSIPKTDTYTAILSVANDIRSSLESYQPRDMVDIQSLIWVAVEALKSPPAKPPRLSEFEQLFAEFAAEYPGTKAGREHAEAYEQSRVQARHNYASIVAAAGRGEDVTDEILLKLLPYSDTKSNRERGAWIHIAPSVTKDVKAWFEGSKWTQPGDWPKVAQAILAFVQRCVDHPDQLGQACAEFAGLPYAKGFQTGMLTPILNALRPDDFLLINNKSRKALNHFTSANFMQALVDYPAANEALKEFILKVEDLARLPGIPYLTRGDAFDMFSHWLVGVRKYPMAKGTGDDDEPGEVLGQPFDQLFSGLDEAEWAFNLIADAMQQLGITGVDDPRFSVTLRDEGGKHHLHFSFGQWLILGFDGSDGSLDNLAVALLTKDIGIKPLSVGTFAASDGSVQAYLPHFTVRSIRPFEGQIKVAFAEALASAKDRFSTWRATPFRKHSSPELAQAILDPAFRAKLLHDGMPESVPPVPPVPPIPNCPFNLRTFELLAQLHETPTASVYREHKDEFHSKLEEPFQKLLAGVAATLPSAISDRMETAKKVFSRIPKNDYGQGGAWDFYWGAFYPKGGKRTEDAQLFLWMNHERMEIGFYIGDYGADRRERFRSNCQRYAGQLDRILAPVLGEMSILFGSRHDFTIQPDGQVMANRQIALQDWLRDPEVSDYSAAVVLPRDQVLQSSEIELQQRILSVYKALYTLVLLAVTDDPLPALKQYLGSEDEEELPPNPDYTLARCAVDTGFSESDLDRWVHAIRRKSQAIIYGPPGTGKTYLATKLAEHLIGGSDGFVEAVQFHPAYAYEDFVQGIRPQRTDGGLDYPILPGRFMQFCAKAQRRKGNCVLIIDEINRANIARVFGELMYLLEYRDREIPLAVGTRFQIPANVFLIGTMNTADRSIALVDHALRRRFAFIALYPNYDVLRHYHERTGFTVDGLVHVLQRLNQRIGDRHYEVGVSFFMRADLADTIRDIWQMEIEPYLEEFFFDQPASTEEFRWEKVGSQILPA